MSTVTRLLTMMNRPPSRIHLDAAGCFSTKLFHQFLIAFMVLRLLCEIQFGPMEKMMDQPSHAPEEMAVDDE